LFLCNDGSILRIDFTHQHDIQAGLVIADVNDGTLDFVQVFLSFRLDLETAKETTEHIVATSDRVIDEVSFTKDGEYNGHTHAINSHNQKTYGGHDGTVVKTAVFAIHYQERQY